MCETPEYKVDHVATALFVNAPLLKQISITTLDVPSHANGVKLNVLFAYPVNVEGTYEGL